jgi:hypothetical protein
VVFTSYFTSRPQKDSNILLQHILHSSLSSPTTIKRTRKLCLSDLSCLSGTTTIAEKCNITWVVKRRRKTPTCIGVEAALKLNLNHLTVENHMGKYHSSKFQPWGCSIIWYDSSSAGAQRSIHRKTFTNLSCSHVELYPLSLWPQKCCKTFVAFIRISLLST